jgi:hypothetical protein
MWTNKYMPSDRGWYLVKINGLKSALLWNDYNHFFAGVDGKTYNFNDIDSWLDDSRAGNDLK